ncbi:MFS transporter [Pseudonocardia asaccharolytica]|uniref:MFS transporter n=1 Tax=Pseudonocardia asaccharolytica DSM 44247 = NBRC 16224 TaxID=1123024 RepID=A0A511DA00_9PSEU|nr:MFS transporter [Pseudonocardia asaccharolytica]GEL19778.1 MFS transporter [Pseudonocardia asaccharolytica DSM 44247 = NBRC 16224]
MNRWKPLIALGAAQFLVVLDTSVMNVSISQLVEDFQTDVAAIQATITIYTLVMAAFLITGGKVGDLIGRRRAFAAGLVIYGIGSALTAVAPTLWMLILGWSIIEGLGGALVLPALAALVGGNYAGRQRAAAYGVIGGLAGAGIAVGPLLGGWVTTYLTWRLVFAGEVVVVVLILAAIRWIRDVPVAGPRRELDVVGAALSVVGLALVVLGVLQSATWGWLRPRNSPVTVFGFSLTPFVIIAGLVLLGLLRSWLRHRERQGRDPLVRWALLDIPPLRAAVSTLLAQNLILLGLFFTIPLYLQVVQGFNAFETGLRLLPVSITMLVTSMSAPLLNKVATPRQVVRVGFAVLVVATLWLVAAVKPQIDDASFAAAMAVLGIGMGLLAAQLGNIAQSSVGEADRSEVGGLQYTAQNLGSSLGTALIGSILIGALTVAAQAGLAGSAQVSDAVKQQVGIAIAGGISFVPIDQVRAALTQAQLPPAEAEAITATYADAQLQGLKVALLAAAAIALLSLFLTRNLPGSRLAEQPGGAADATALRPPAGPGADDDLHKPTSRPGR